jgi:hypothetical protein
MYLSDVQCGCPATDHTSAVSATDCPVWVPAVAHVNVRERASDVEDWTQQIAGLVVIFQYSPLSFHSAISVLDNGARRTYVHVFDPGIERTRFRFPAAVGLQKDRVLSRVHSTVIKNLMSVLYVRSVSNKHTHSIDDSKKGINMPFETLADPCFH